MSAAKSTPEAKAAMSARRAIYTYSLVSPEGELHIIKNLEQFCKEHELNQAAMVKVVNGKRPHHKGWTGEKING